MRAPKFAWNPKRARPRFCRRIFRGRRTEHSVCRTSPSGSAAQKSSTKNLVRARFGFHANFGARIHSRFPQGARNPQDSRNDKHLLCCAGSNFANRPLSWKVPRRGDKTARRVRAIASLPDSIQGANGSCDKKFRASLFAAFPRAFGLDSVQHRRRAHHRAQFLFLNTGANFTRCRS